MKRYLEGSDGNVGTFFLFYLALLVTTCPAAIRGLTNTLSTADKKIQDFRDAFSTLREEFSDEVRMAILGAVTRNEMSLANVCKLPRSMTADLVG